MANLNWSAYTDSDWILLNGQPGTNGINGIGSMAVSVELLPSTTINDPDTIGEITFVCLNCDGSVSKTVNVTRCPLTESECEKYKGDTTYEYTKVGLNVGKCETQRTTNIQYSATTTYNRAGCGNKVVTGITSTTVVFGENPSAETRTLKFDYGGKPDIITIIQQAGPCTEECECSSLNATWGSIEALSCSSQTVTLCTYNSDTCVTNIVPSANVTWVKAFNVNDSSITCVIDTNTSDSPREGIIYISYDKSEGNSCVALQHSIKQNAADDGCKETQICGIIEPSGNPTVNDNCETEQKFNYVL